MLLASTALGAVVLTGLLLGLTLLAMHDARSAVLSAEVAERRYRAWSEERAGIVAARTAIADGVQAGTDAIQLGAGLAQSGHQAIASLPFGILRAIPMTREGSSLVRDTHDETADSVYDRIASVSDGVGRAVRKKLLGGPVAPPPED
jgi:hypothetical protein